jgi:hypothetical protein
VTRPDLSAIRAQHATVEGERWEYMPAMTDDAIIMHRVYDDEGHCIAECSSPTLAAFIAAAPSTVAGLLAVVDAVEKVRQELFAISNDDGWTVEQRAVYRDASRAIYAALTEEGE